MSGSAHGIPISITEKAITIFVAQLMYFMRESQQDIRRQEAILLEIGSDINSLLDAFLRLSSDSIPNDCRDYVLSMQSFMNQLKFA